jgi:hypothetical protein
MIFLIKIIFSLSIVHALWLAYLAAWKPAHYVVLVEKTTDRGFSRRIVQARFLWAWMTAWVVMIPGASFAFSFLPMEWGRWEEGEFMPAHQSLAGMVSLTASILLYSCVDKAGRRKAVMEYRTEVLSGRISDLEAELSEARDSARRHMDDFEAQASASLKKAEDRNRKLDASYGVVRKELVRLKAALDEATLAAHEEREKIERAKEEKPRIFYS